MKNIICVGTKKPSSFALFFRIAAHDAVGSCITYHYHHYHLHFLQPLLCCIPKSPRSDHPGVAVHTRYAFARICTDLHFFEQMCYTSGDGRGCGRAASAGEAVVEQ